MKVFVLNFKKESLFETHIRYILTALFGLFGNKWLAWINDPLVLRFLYNKLLIKLSIRLYIFSWPVIKNRAK